MIPVDAMTVLKYAVVAVASVFFTISVLNYLDVRRSGRRIPKRVEVKEVKEEAPRFEGVGDFINSVNIAVDPPKPKTLAEVLEELIMRKLADVNVSLTVEIPETTIKLFDNEAKLSGKVTITTKREVSESEGKGVSFRPVFKPVIDETEV